MQAIKIKMMGQSAAKSMPINPDKNTNPKPQPDPMYLKHPTQGAHILPKMSPRHIINLKTNYCYYSSVYKTSFDYYKYKNNKKNVPNCVNLLINMQFTT